MGEHGVVLGTRLLRAALLHHAQPLPGSAEEMLQELARKHRIWLVNGSMYERKEGAIYNTTSVIGRYCKMFPFLPMEQGVAAGTEFLVFDVPEVGRFGVLNCYDMWFPETSRQVTAMGAEVILHPVLTHTIDRDVDLAVAHATSAMMQCYVFDINGLGAGGNGHSAVFDPSGRVLFRGDVCEQIIPIEIDLEQVRRQRKNGIRGLGQLAKSFRDRPTEFPVYAQGFDRSYLEFPRTASTAAPRGRATCQRRTDASVSQLSVTRAKRCGMVRPAGTS